MNQCPESNKCGGCRYTGTPYEEQLKKKQKTVKQLLGKYGKVCDIIGMDNPEHYRNKVHAVFDFQKGKGIVSGIYQEGTHNVVPVDECLLEDRKADAIIVSIRQLAKSFRMKIYDEDTGYGLLRHVLVRVGHATGQIMVVLVLGSPILPSKKNFVNVLCKLHPEITTIVLNVNNKKTSMVLGDKEQVIYGKGYIEDRLCGKTFRISPKSFYQVNAVQTEKLYNKAIEYAALTGRETIIDAYCGIGTIGLAAAEHVKKVIGVELNQAAVKDAVVNAKINGIKNADFYQNDAGKFMIQLADAGEKIDVVFMDPPRSGSTEEFMNAVLCLQPDRIVYISCNPETLARDLEYLTGKGQKNRAGKSAGSGKENGRKNYRVVEMTPVDMFPYTDNIETVCLLSKLNVEHHI
ncbi:MAG: 23S rRNA (uracil(1939)-C(5))-methyltransferase RlmD [Lachnospiraceae bacterium]|nr:23S rRNA (uracil(1939)-C(5))-methyltransferase RlmD [Lachnospiraceae bacterium]